MKCVFTIYLLALFYESWKDQNPATFLRIILPKRMAREIASLHNFELASIPLIVTIGKCLVSCVEFLVAPLLLCRELPIDLS